MRIVAWIYMSTFHFIGVCGLHCLECDDVLKPAYCDTVTRCGTHEHCYVDAKLSTAGSIRYSLGCRDSLRCSQTHNVAKRDILNMRQNSSFEIDGLLHNQRSGGNWACSECCTGDVCNSAGCGAKGYPSQRGPICFNCPQQGTEADCNKITMCGQDQVCMLHKTTDPVIHETFYESRCESEQKCNDQLPRYNLLPDVLVGKRRRRNAVIYQDTCRLQCCKTSLCNVNCTNESILGNKLSTDGLSVTQRTTRMTTLPRTSPSSLTTMSSTSSVVSLAKSSTPAACIDVLPECVSTNSRNTICLSQVLATKYCRKSCGYCRRSPTAQPGLIPGPSPTAQPGLLPGHSPTAQTGLLPGPSPTAQPGETSTAQLGLYPGHSPTAQPGLLPGQTPTYQPGLLPGQSPTSQPGLLPGHTPTAQPGLLPGQSPIAQLGLLPGQTPSAQQGLLPGQSPTAQPGLLQGQTPTAQPGLLPGQSPTAQPGLLPGQTPTAQPGLLPGQSPTAQSGLIPGHSPTAHPGLVSGQTPTAAPGLLCKTVETKRWSMWVGRHTVQSMGGDSEKMTPEELSRFCQRGTIDGIQCETLGGRSYLNAGDITTCEIENGLICDEFQNFPIGCQDYRVRYQCTDKETICQYTTLLILQTSTVSTNTSELCQNRWSAWINSDSPSTGDGDRESWTKAEQHAFCPNGNITSIECMTTSGIPSYSTGEIMQCAIQGGSVCLNVDLFPIRCSDYKIRYFCTCGG